MSLRVPESSPRLEANPAAGKTNNDAGDTGGGPAPARTSGTSGTAAGPGPGKTSRAESAIIKSGIHDNDMIDPGLNELPPVDPHAKDKRVEPRLSTPFLEPFIGTTWQPTGLRVLDIVIDVLSKIAMSPVLLLVGIADVIGEPFGARLYDHIVCAAMRSRFNITGRDIDAGLSYYRHKSDGEISTDFARLARRGDFPAILDRVDLGKRHAIEGLMVARLHGPDASAWILDRLIVSGPRWDYLTDRVLHRLYASGELDATLAVLKKMRPADPRLEFLAERGADIPRPLVIGHRGMPGEHMENSIESLQAALDAGADGVEFDMCLTKDGKVVMWHDNDPDNVVALMRQAGLEPGQAYHPVVPNLGSELRKPIHELTYAQWKAGYGYQKNTAEGLLNDKPVTSPKIPEITEVGAWAARRGNKLKRLCLDTKLPENATDAMIKAYAAGIREAFGPVAEKCLFMSPYKNVIARLKQELAGSGFKFTYDTEIVSPVPDPKKVTGLREGMQMGNDTVSVGMPRIGIDGAEVFNEVTYRLGQEARMHDANPDVVFWTLNKEEEFRDILGTGVAGAILTDNVASLRRLVDELCPRPQGDNPLRPPSQPNAVLAAPKS